MDYKKVLQEIKNLPWQNADPEEIILVSLATAREFASSLRDGIVLYPDDVHLQEMYEGELNTDNMSFDGYTDRGDHWQFLQHFVDKKKIATSSNRLVVAVEKYNDFVLSLSKEERAMTIFSREEELTGIFKKIVESHPWKKLGLKFYEYYLRQHILLDSTEHGHAHLVSHFPLHKEVLDRFYAERLTLYKSLF